MRQIGTILLALLALLVIGAAALLWVQNAETRVDLVWNLPPVGGWYLAKAAPLPGLVLASFGIGVLLCWTWFAVAGMAAGVRNRTLQRQVGALQDELTFLKRGTARPATSSTSSPSPPQATSAATSMAVAGPSAATPPAPAPAKAPSPPSPPGSGDFDDVV